MVPALACRKVPGPADGWIRNEELSEQPESGCTSVVSAAAAAAPIPRTPVVLTKDAGEDQETYEDRKLYIARKISV